MPPDEELRYPSPPPIDSTTTTDDEAGWVWAQIKSRSEARRRVRASFGKLPLFDDSVSLIIREVARLSFRKQALLFNASLNSLVRSLPRHFRFRPWSLRRCCC
ncbi:hypothetical protein OIU79_024574 [Salix purpurea]|uniref:Uncharacterized protein n=1 Tax=Salix purpurea TaxID=77065 RepID=A0A9Q0WB94_SALPP|nr:hypothetical protein OIU79_024574 [Salix purpurea]